MKKIGITDSEKKLLFIVCAFLILAAAYFLGYVKLMDAAKAVEASNETSAATVSQLEAMVAKQADTEKETKGYKDGIQKVIDKYPSAVPQEKAIYLVQEFQDAIGTDVSNIAFSMNNVVQSFSGDNAPVGRYASLIIQYSSDYDQFKDLIKYVSEYPDRTNIPSLTAAYDQGSGGIKGQLTYKLFYLTNTDREYKEIPETGIEKGKAGIFYSGSSSPMDELLEELMQLEQLAQ